MPRSSVEPDGRLLDVVARVERADADPHLVARGERPAVARARRSPCGSTPRGPRTDPPGWTSSPRESSASGGWTLSSAPEHAPPAERVDEQRRRDVAAVGVDRRCRCGRRPSRSRTRPPTAPTAARTAAGSRRSRTSTPIGQRAVVRRVDDQRVEGLEDRILEPEVAQPLGRSGACGGLALADLVAVEHQHAGAGAAQLARDRRDPRTTHRRSTTSKSPLSGVLSAPRFVARTGMFATVSRR